MQKCYESSKRVLVYCRESRDDYGENYERIETQRDILLDFCKRNGLNNIVDIIMDDNMSGTSFKRLDDIKNMMEKGRIDVFICKDASRLGRNLLESLKFIEFAENNCVQIMFESEEFNPELFPLIAWFNERRAKDDSDKIRRVLRHKLENGLVISAPFGYKKENGVMVIDEETAPIVKKIFEMAANESTASQIADYLNIVHAVSPSQGNKSFNTTIHPIWTRDKVRRILQNPTYTGTQVAAKREKVSFKSKKYVRVPTEKQIVIPNHHEPIIDERTFKKAQLNINSLVITKRNPTDNPFSGLLFCGRCGKRIIVRKRENNKAVRYVCAKYNNEGKIKDDLREGWGCNPHIIEYEDLKETVMTHIRQFVENDDFREQVLSGFDTNLGLNEATSKLNVLNKKEQQLKSRFDMLYEDKAKGILPEFIFVEKTSGIVSELEDIRNQIKLTESEIKEVNNIDVKKQYETIIKKLYEKGITAEGMSALFEKIIVYEPDEITVQDKEKYNITDTMFEQILNEGGTLFIQKAPWSSIINNELKK